MDVDIAVADYMPKAAEAIESRGIGAVVAGSHSCIPPLRMALRSSAGHVSRSTRSSWKSGESARRRPGGARERRSGRRRRAEDEHASDALGRESDRARVDLWYHDCHEAEGIRGDERSSGFELVISELVEQEAEAGDPDASRLRLATIQGIAILALSDEAVSIAEHLVGSGPIPREAAADALHIAVAALNGVDYLLTWNCKHLANAALRVQIAALLEDAGYACPVICTPEELMEG